MIAEHIRAAAHAHAGGTVLVVVGYFHKPDLEAHLKPDHAISLVSASSIGRPTIAEAESVTTTGQRAAILSFNLLGRQAASGVYNIPWLEKILAGFSKERPGPEADLFKLRLNELAGRTTSRRAARDYEKIAAVAGDQRFTWTGLKDESRLDSYFDPFGGLGVADRAGLECARVKLAMGQRQEAERLLARIRSKLNTRRAREFDAYVEDYLRDPSH
jgi:hypothetical protein